MGTRGIGVALLVTALGFVGAAQAQDEPAEEPGAGAETDADAEGDDGAAPPEEAEARDSRDEEARMVFQAGNTAFEDARYADALEYFQRAYELSGRAVLLYNIGVAADRLREDRVALDAFERFLAEVPEHPRRRDVEARVIVLREAVDRGEAAPAEVEGGEGGEAVGDGAETPPAATSSGPDVVTLVGASALGALGLAGVIAGIVGIAGAGQCLDEEEDVCVEERVTNWAGTGTYLGLGIAAIAGAVIWLVVGLSGGGDEDAAVSVGPNGELTWRF